MMVPLCFKGASYSCFNAMMIYVAVTTTMIIPFVAQPIVQAQTVPQTQCEIVDYDFSSFSAEAINEITLASAAINNWATSTATADLSMDAMEVAPLYVAELKDICNAAGGSMLYGTIPSTLDCQASDGYPQGKDGALRNQPLCVNKGCDSSMIGEELVSCSTNAVFTDEPQDFLSGGSSMYGTGILTLASFLTALTFFLFM